MSDFIYYTILIVIGFQIFNKFSKLEDKIKVLEDNIVIFRRKLKLDKLDENQNSSPSPKIADDSEYEYVEEDTQEYETEDIKEFLENQNNTQIEETEEVEEFYEDKIDVQKAEIPVSAVKKENYSLEKEIGTKLTVWGGAIALILSAFFLVKYSIDNGLLTPKFRVAISFITGIAFLFLADWIKNNDKFANGKKISQSLAGASVAILYISTFSAFSLYGLISYGMGFLLMTAITIISILLTLTYGLPVATLGMFGGFITPLLFNQNALSTPLMLIYVYMLFASFIYIMKKENLWQLSLPATIFSLIWLISIILTRHLNDVDVLFITLFIMSFVSTMIYQTKELEQDYKATLNFVAIVPSVLLMGALTSRVNYDALSLLLYGLISVSSLILALRNEKEFGYVPVCTLIVNLLMLLAWDFQFNNSVVAIIAIYTTLYSAASYYLFKEGKNSLLWIAMLCCSLLGYLSVAYIKFPDQYDNIIVTIGLIFSGLLGYIFRETYLNFKDEKIKNEILSVINISIVCFVTAAILELSNTTIQPILFSLEILGIAYVGHRFSLKINENILYALIVFFVYSIFDSIKDFFEGIIKSLGHFLENLFKSRLKQSYKINIQTIELIMNMIIPSFVLYYATVFMKKAKYFSLSTIYKNICIILLSSAIYVMASNSTISRSSLSLLHISTLTFIFYALGFGFNRLGYYLKDDRIQQASKFFIYFAIFRVVILHLFIYNPKFNNIYAGNFVIFNYLLLSFAVPALLNYLTQIEFKNLLEKEYTNILNLIFLLFFVILNVTIYFHGGYISRLVDISNAEIYTYSVMLLLMGVSFLIAGKLKSNSKLRYISLALILIAVGKVFLYDSSELEGLYRVFSFFGLGISLIGLSWVYVKYIFTDK